MYSLKICSAFHMHRLVFQLIYSLSLLRQVLVLNNITKTIWLRDGSVGKGPWRQVWCSEFDSWNSHSGRTEESPTSCPLLAHTCSEMNYAKQIKYKKINYINKYDFLLGAGSPPLDLLYLLSFKMVTILYRWRKPVLHSEAKINSISSSWVWGKTWKISWICKMNSLVYYMH